MKNRIVLFAAAAALVSGPALATDLCTDVKERKSVDEAKAVVIAAGYADVQKMDEEDGCYEAKGLNADGSRFEVYVHPSTLEIVKVKTEN